MTKENIILRPMEPTDGAAIDLLGQQTPDTGAVAFFMRFRHDAYDVLTKLNPGVVGVVAEVPAREGLVGMGLLTFGECWYEGELRPFAYLSGLSVHPNYRRLGVASKLAAWRVDTAHARFREIGKAGVIFAAIQTGNLGSLQVSKTWSTQLVKGQSQLAIAAVRHRPPKPVPGLEVRIAQFGELEEIAQKQNTFYDSYNLYPPQTGESLNEWRSRSAFGYPLHDYYVAVDRTGNILAGLGITEEGRLITSHVLRMPQPLRVANLFLRLIPPDGVSRRINVEQFWFAFNHIHAGQFLWESTRWLLRERGTVLALFFDPSSPLRKAVILPKFMPETGGSIALSAPTPMPRGRHIYLHV